MKGSTPAERQTNPANLRLYLAKLANSHAIPARNTRELRADGDARRVRIQTLASASREK
jgi:hypothetical protein